MWRDTPTMFVRGLLVIAVMTAASTGCAGQTGCGGSAGPACTRVLFIGNSYTYVNDMPMVFADLAESDGRQGDVGMLAGGGASLADHA